MEAQYSMLPSGDKSNFKAVITKARTRYDEFRKEFLDYT